VPETSAAAPAAGPVGAPPEQPPEFSEAEILRIQMALVAHCETQRDRFALLDPPAVVALEDGLGISGVCAWRRRFDSSHAGLCYPWIRVADPVLGGLRDVPACGYLAGLYARNDLTVGVHKAPANEELQGVAAPTIAVDEALQGVLNPLG